MSYVIPCPDCGTLREYKLKKTYLRSLRKKSLCRSCKQIGNRNHMFGKTGVENPNCGQVRVSMRGANNPFFGKFGIEHPKFGIKHKNVPTGEEHWSWNPNKSDDERQMGRVYPEYYSFRKEIFEERNYTCEITGQRGCHLIMHHLKSYAKYPNLRLDKDNVVVIKKELHDRFHEKYGKNNFTEQDFYTFILELTNVT